MIVRLEFINCLDVVKGSFMQRMQGCQIGFFDAKFQKFGFLKAVGVKKLFGFGFLLFNI